MTGSLNTLSRVSASDVLTLHEASGAAKVPQRPGKAEWTGRGRVDIVGGYREPAVLPGLDIIGEGYHQKDPHILSVQFGTCAE